MKTMKKRKKKTRLVKYFTKALLQEAARNAEKWDYNRQLDLDAINTLPDARFPVVFTFLHHHRHGVLAEPHMRAMVEMGPQGIRLRGHAACILECRAACTNVGINRPATMYFLLSGLPSTRSEWS